MGGDVAAALTGALTAGSAAALARWLRLREREAVVAPLCRGGRSNDPATASLISRLRGPRLFRVGAAVGGGVLGAAMAGPPGAILGLAAGIGTPVWIRRRNRAREAAMMEEGLAEAVAAMSAGMRAGLSLSQSIRFASEEVGPPLAEVFGELVQREELGVPLATALEGWTEPDRPRDLRLVGGILQLHRRTGGDLPSVLDQLSETLRDRAGASRELRGYTAQARLSGTILGCLPIGFFLFLSITSRNDIAAAYRTPIGAGAIVTGLLLEGLAFVWIRRLLRVSL